MTRAQLFEDLRRTLEAPESNGAFDAALRITLGHFGADSGTLHLMGADGALHLKAHGPMPPEVLERIQVIPVGRGMAGLAVERREPVETCNLQEDTTGDVRPGAKATGMRGSICIPLMNDEVAVGALGVAHRGEHDFSAAERELLMEVGHLLGASLAS